MAKKLTPKQILFIDAYIVNDGNGTQAAEDAGYDGNREVLAAIAYENLRKPHIAAEIDRKLSQFMSADEVLYRLSEIARADIGDALDDSGNPDIGKARELRKTKHIKRVRQKSITTTDKDGAGSDINETEIEMYDKLKALELLGKKHKLWVDRQELTGANGAPLKVIIEEKSGDDSASE